MQADVRGAVCERRVEHGSGDLAGLGRRHVAARAERPEIDLVAQCLQPLPQPM